MPTKKRGTVKGGKRIKSEIGKEIDATAVKSSKKRKIDQDSKPVPGDVPPKKLKTEASVSLSEIDAEERPSTEKGVAAKLDTSVIKDEVVDESAMFVGAHVSAAGN